MHFWEIAAHSQSTGSSDCRRHVKQGCKLNQAANIDKLCIKSDGKE